MKTIVCVDRNWGIGSNNDLLYHIPADMKFFREHTTGNVCVMGLATLLSFPGGRPLKDRVNIVLCDDPTFACEGAVVVGNMDELKTEVAKYDTDKVFVIGGASVYAQLIDMCDTAYITKVDAGDKKAEKFFPNLDEKPEWHLEYEGEMQEHNGINFRFTTYRK